MSDRREYYKAGRKTYSLTTCDCCKNEGFQDAWQCSGGADKKISSLGVRARTFAADNNATLITEKEARRRVPHAFPTGEQLTA